MTRRNAAVAMLLADLRAELLTAPSEPRAAEQVAMMRFEDQLLAPALRRSPIHTPVRASAHSSSRSAFGLRLRRQGSRTTSTRARRFAALFAAIGVISGSIGLPAAGALPGAVRQITEHITDTIVHTFSVPQASDPHSEGPQPRIAAPNEIDGALPAGPSAAPMAVAPGSGDDTATAPATAPTSTAAGDDVQQPSAPDGPAVTPVTSDQQSGSGPVRGTRRPPKKNMQKDPDTPPGLPSDWNPRAVAAARAQLETCAQSTDLAPVGCPQVATSDPAVTPANVHWTLLNQPLAGATAIARANGVAHQTAISVFGLFQLVASYTVGTDPQLHYAYSSGVARATMTWDGSNLLAVSFTSGSVADQLPTGVLLPPFERPAGITDATVLAAVASGLAAWVSGAGTSLVGDPTQGAVVSFDAVHGSFTVSGTYSSAPSDGSGPAVSHAYSAALVANGSALQVLSIAEA
jgi:hypothetical protein